MNKLRRRSGTGMKRIEVPYTGPKPLSNRTGVDGSKTSSPGMKGFKAFSPDSWGKNPYDPKK